jgi:hypothetical protein
VRGPGERSTVNGERDKRLRAALSVLFVLSVFPQAAAAQWRPVFEWGLHGTANIRGTADGIANGPVALVFGPRGAIRTLGSTRIALSIGAGTHGDELTARGEAALEYLLSPRASGRFGVYLGGGLAGVLGGGKGGYLLTYVGIERSPGLPAGWAFEAGFGGGFRLRAAYHWRRFPPGWRAQP